MKYRGGYLIGQIQLLHNRLLNRLLKLHGIQEFKSEQGKILYQLWLEDGLSVSDLANRTGLAINTLSKMLYTLEKQGLLIRQVQSIDKRKKYIFLTEISKALKGKAMDISAIMVDAFYAGMSEDEAIVFDQQLEGILKNLLDLESQI